jgi:hypothetical protein
MDREADWMEYEEPEEESPAFVRGQLERNLREARNEIETLQWLLEPAKKLNSASYATHKERTLRLIESIEETIVFLEAELEGDQQ